MTNDGNGSYYLGHDDSEEFVEDKIALLLWKICSPILLVVGTFGNMMTIAVLVQKRNRGATIAMYLTALAVADLLVIWTGLLRQWIKYQFNYDIRTYSSALCKTHNFIVSFGLHLSAWLLVSVTVERFTSVWLPHKVKRICIPKYACLVILLVTFSLMILNVNWFFGSDLSYGNNTSCICDVVETHKRFFTTVWWKIDLFVLSVVPFGIIFVTNTLIISRLLLRRRNLRRIQPSENTDGSQNRIHGAIRPTHVLRFLFFLNIVFIVCTLPSSLYLVLQPLWEATGGHDKAVDNLWWAVTNLLLYLNNTVNFILYFLSGSRFRQEFKAMFCIKHLKRGGTKSSLNSNKAGAF